MFMHVEASMGSSSSSALPPAPPMVAPAVRPHNPSDSSQFFDNRCLPLRTVALLGLHQCPRLVVCQAAYIAICWHLFPVPYAVAGTSCSQGQGCQGQCCQGLSIYLTVDRSIWQSVYRSIDLSIYLSIYPLDLSIHLSIYPYIHLSIYLSI